VRCVHDGPADQIEITDWIDAIDEVRRAVA